MEPVGAAMAQNAGMAPLSNLARRRLRLAFIGVLLGVALLIVPILAKELPLMRDQVPVLFDNLPSSKAQIDAGKMRLLASPRKIPSMTGFGLEITGFVDKN